MSAPSLDPELEQASWDLGHLVDEAADPAARTEELLAEAQRRAEAFATAHRGKVAQLDGPGLAQAIADLAEVSDLAGRAGSYAALWFSTDTAAPERGRLYAQVQEASTHISTALLFFELEWADLDDAKAEELLAADGVEQARHHLRAARRYKPFQLSEPEERLSREKDLTGASAWSRLFDELTSAIRVDLGPEAGGEVALDAALSRITNPSREVRAATAEAVTKALAPGLRTRAYVFNTLLQDKAVEDRLRGFPTWVSARNLDNEASDASVEALVAAVQNRYDLPQRWYRLKAKLLGLDRLADYDRMASVSAEEETFSYAQGRDLVLECFEGFDPRFGGLARRFFDEGWIDAPVRENKRGGAFCAYTVPSVHPYVLLNWTHKRRDVLTLAHELGHGLHAALAGPRGPFEMSTPLTLAETASVFGEQVVHGRLLEVTESADSRLGLLADAVDDAVATVFRQVAMNRFEHAVHTHRREQGELGVEDFNAHWAASQEALLGDSVEVTEGYRTWWSYVPHFLHTPGYVYAYAYGQLLALSVYRRYQQEGPEFVDAYLELLAAGGSKPPEELAAIVGIDLADPGFWDSGLQLVEEQLDRAEAAAVEAGRA